jgi:hypothetical protein
MEGACSTHGNNECLLLAGISRRRRPEIDIKIIVKWICGGEIDSAGRG